MLPVWLPLIARKPPWTRNAVSAKHGLSRIRRKYSASWGFQTAGSRSVSGMPRIRWKSQRTKRSCTNQLKPNVSCSAIRRHSSAGTSFSDAPEPKTKTVSLRLRALSSSGPTSRYARRAAR